MGLLSLTGFLRFGIEGASTGSMGGDISGCTSCHPSSSATFSGGVVVLTTVLCKSVKNEGCERIVLKIGTRT